MKEKILTESEGKDYIIQLNEKEILELKNKIAKKDDINSIVIGILFPLAILGVFHVIENWSLSVREMIFTPLILILFVLPLAILGWLVEKINKR